MVTPMLRPDLFGGFATHAGDALFEAYCAKDFGTARLLRDKYGGSYNFWDDTRAPAGEKPGGSRAGQLVGHGGGVLR